MHLSVHRTRASIIACHACAAVLDAMPAFPHACACRIAPDELLLIAPPSLGELVRREAEAHFTRVEAGALVVDESDGWAIRSLRGEEAMRVLAQLSEIRLPSERPAFVQGAVAGAPAKLLLLGGTAHVFVPYPLRDHLDGRLHDVSGFGVGRAADEQPFAIEPPAPPILGPLAERAAASAPR